jgi:prepilin-type N-terminal cleavage/methylation domain-containing protein
MRYPIQSRHPLTRRPRGRRGFTLIEAAMVTVIIGVGVVAMLQLLAAGTVSNSEGTELTTAINLANNIREMSIGLAYYDPTDMAKVPPVYDWNTKEATVKDYDNIMDLDGQTDTWNLASDPQTGYQVFSPPIDVRRDPISNYSGWAQWVKVETVSANSVSTVLPHDATSPTARVTVKIMRNNTEVYRMSWLAVAPKAN